MEHGDFEEDLDAVDPTLDEDGTWDSWRARIGRLIALNVEDRGLLSDQEVWATLQLGEILVAAGRNGEMDVDQTLFRLCEMLYQGRGVGALADTLTAFARVLLAAFAKRGLTFELALDELHQALEEVTRQHQSPKATSTTTTGAIPFDDDFPDVQPELPAWW